MNELKYGSKNDNFITRGYIFAFFLICSLFFMWAIANNFNDVLIKHFQKAFDLSRGQSGIIQTAFYIGYFVMALPAGTAMKRFGYKNGIIFGLILYMIGAFLFYPAAEVRQYWFFLIALFIIASGLAFLETAANPFITVMGRPDRGSQRLNLAQAFNGVGAVFGPILAGKFILSGVEFSTAELAVMTPEAIDAYQASEAKQVQVPYLFLAGTVALIALLVFFTRMPHIKSDGGHQTDETGTLFSSILNLLKIPHLRYAVIAQFFYVGAQICIWSFFINYIVERLPETSEKQAASFLSWSIVGFMTGRITGTLLMSRIRPHILLACFAGVNVMLCLLAMFFDGIPAAVFYGLISFFMSIMFPTIFSLGIRGLGKQTELGSSLIIMAIIGGAVLPPVMGFVSDVASLQFSVIIPLICFVVVLLYAWREEYSVFNKG